MIQELAKKSLHQNFQPFSNPKKNLSQYFLIDSNICEKIIRVSVVEPYECILEIGPGKGALTQKLIKSTTRLIAIEKDVDLVQHLKKSIPFLHLYEGDALCFPLRQLLKEHLMEKEKARIIANIPYHITTDLILKMLELRHFISSAILMVQKEVAEKLCSALNRASSWSHALIRSYTSIRYLFAVSRDCFYPKPKVHSAVIKLEFKEIPLEIDESFSFFLKRLFQAKRKQIFPLLSSMYSKDHSRFVLNNLQIAENTRPIALKEQDLMTLFFLLEKI